MRLSSFLVWQCQRNSSLTELNVANPFSVYIVWSLCVCVYQWINAKRWLEMVRGRVEGICEHLMKKETERYHDEWEERLQRDEYFRLLLSSQCSHYESFLPACYAHSFACVLSVHISLSLGMVRQMSAQHAESATKSNFDLPMFFHFFYYLALFFIWFHFV